MGKYYFHTDDGVHHHDEEGADLPGLDAVREHALQVTRDALAADPAAFWVDESFRLTVTDDTGLTLLVIDVCATLSPAAG